MIRFSELVSAFTPSDFAQFALVLFLAVFAAVAIRESRKDRRREHAGWARLPLDEAPTMSTTSERVETATTNPGDLP